MLVQRELQLLIAPKAEGKVGRLMLLRALLTYERQMAGVTQLQEVIVCHDPVVATDAAHGYVLHQSGQKRLELLELWLGIDAFPTIGEDRVDQLGQ